MQLRHLLRRVGEDDVCHLPRVAVDEKLSPLRVRQLGAALHRFLDRGDLPVDVRCALETCNAYEHGSSSYRGRHDDIDARGLGVAIPVIVVAAAARPAVLGHWVQGFFARRGIDAPLIRGRELIVVVLVNLVAWIGTGLGFLVLLNGLSGEPSPGLMWAIATYSVGYLVGFVVPFLPGGLGAREGALVAVLAPRYGVGAATGISLITRLAVTMGEALAIGLIYVSYAGARALDRLRGAVAPASSPIVEPEPPAAD